MALTPEEIEGREFPVVTLGYDREKVDRFLNEVAASYRFAVRQLMPGVRPVHEAPAGAAPSDSFERLGNEVAEVLRSTQHLADSLRAEAEEQAVALRRQAEQDASDAVQAADRDRDQAKRVLLRAQERAEAIVAEAEAQVEHRLAAAEADAEERARHVLARSEQRAEQVLRAERAAVDRLRTARADLEEAIARLTGSETSPVVDLTTGEAIVRVGDIPQVSRAVSAEDEGDDDAPPKPSNPGRDDPVQRMVRAAVVRALEHPVTTDPDDAEPGAPEAAGEPAVAEV